jgi:DNA invertase Pin-like site-specific DNA recombinase
MTRVEKRVAIYVRVSTDGQSVDAQLRELREVSYRRGWEIVQEYTDEGISGAKGRDQRPALDAMLKAAMRGEFDTVAAWSVDRLGRSLQHLVVGLSDLQSANIGLYLHKQGLDTSTPSGRAMFGMLGVFAEFEREMIAERVRAGINNARVKGTKTGNPIGRPRTGTDVESKVRKLRGQKWGINRIARELGIGSGTVRRIAYE